MNATLPLPAIDKIVDQVESRAFPEPSTMDHLMSQSPDESEFTKSATGVDVLSRTLPAFYLMAWNKYGEALAVGRVTVWEGHLSLTVMVL